MHKNRKLFLLNIGFDAKDYYSLVKNFVQSMENKLLSPSILQAIRLSSINFVIVFRIAPPFRAVLKCIIIFSSFSPTIFWAKAPSCSNLTPRPKGRGNTKRQTGQTFLTRDSRLACDAWKISKFQLNTHSPYKPHFAPSNNLK